MDRDCGELRAVVTTVQPRYPLSERHGCRALGFERSVMRLVPERLGIDAPLCDTLVRLAAEPPRWSVSRLRWHLRRDGWVVNGKRVEQSYRLEGRAMRRRKRTRLAVPRVPRPISIGPNAIRSPEVVSDQHASGRRLRYLMLIDCSTRE